jgi:hypothetical protein
VGPADGSHHPYLYVPSEGSGYGSQSNVSPRYIALSYCWGSHLWTEKPTLMTTASSVESMKREICMDDLPQTICDAVAITRRLGVRYLWVDALCILQGSDIEAKADWERESSKMGATYGNAYLTIAAAAAHSVHQGIFFLRKYPDRQVAILFSSGNRNSLTEQVHIHNQRYHDCLDEPLYHRGWTLQERILSLRLVIFNRDQLVWNCQTCNMTESGVEMQALGQQRLPTSAVLRSDGALRFWHSIVRDYSCRSFTNATDKLPALSGLASTLYQMTGDKYLAGLWKGTLLDDLLWVNKAPYRGKKVTPSRPKNYRAPSWSWASIDGNIEFRCLPKSSTYFARLKSHRVTLSGLDEFGAVSDGWIKLRGPLIQVLRVGFENGLNFVVPSGERNDPIPVPLGVAALDPGRADLERALARVQSIEDFVDVWVLRIKENVGLILVGLADDDDLATLENEDMAAAEDDESLASVEGTFNQMIVDEKGSGTRMGRWIRTIFRRLPWRRSRVFISPPVSKPVRPPRQKPPQPRKFRRIGMIDLGLLGRQRVERYKKQTVIII